MISDTKEIKIKYLLDATTSTLSPDTLASLRAARTLALDHQRTTRTVPILVWLGHHGGGRNDLFRSSKAMKRAIGILFAAFLLSGLFAWQNYSTEHDICEADIAILTGDMPIKVWLD